MSRARNVLKLAAAATLAVSLSGCISLFPNTEPSQLYRFGQTPAASAPTADSGRMAALSVLKGPIDFPRAAAGDRLLTIGAGGETAYAAQARWISPAVVLFDEALERAFVNAGGVRLINRADLGRTDVILRNEVMTFEARYDQGEKAAPLVVVEVRSLLTKADDRSLIGEKVFRAEVRAADNRLGPIVAAYDQATHAVLAQLTPWTAQTGQAARMAAATAP